MRRAFAVLALLFFCLPVGLRVAGVTGRPFENRDLAAAPDLSAGWDVFDQATRYFVDRLPLREQAVEANTWVALHVWDALPDYARTRSGGPNPLPFGSPHAATPPGGGETPGGGTAEGPGVQVQPGITVVRGRDDWLYLGEELANACKQRVPWSLAIRRFEQLVSIVRASGRRVVFLIPPDKSTIYPEYLPSSYAGEQCAAAGRARTWAAIEATRRPEILGLRRAMLGAKAPPPEELYWRNDSHWNTKGAAVALRAALERLDAGVRVAVADIRRGRRSHEGDLAALIGLRHATDAPDWSIARPAGPTIPGRTLLVDDSYGDVLRPLLEPYAGDLERLSWVFSPPDDILEGIARADVVIFERIERDAPTLAGEDGWVTPRMLARLRARLQAAS